jgi:bacterioferritin
LSDVVTLRQAPRQTVDNGTVASARGADRHSVLQLLNEALATELACTLRCRRHYFMAFGRVADSVRWEFLERAQQQLAHADRIAARIVELNGKPDLNPRGLIERSHAEHTVGDTWLMEEILASEEAHAEDLASLLQDTSSGAGRSARS